MKVLREGYADAVVTDPPYELGFMGKKWDGTGIAYDAEFWRAVYRALKPGGHLLAFGGTRTYHRMACAIEDAGFEIRDSLHWVYGSGFPKSLNVSKAIDESLGAERPVVGQQMSQLPGGNTFAQDEWSKAHRGTNGQTCVYLKAGQPCQGHDSGESQGKTFHAALTSAGSPEAARWEGWGTALKPAHEPIILARKPLAGTVAANVLAHGTGGLNVDGCRLDPRGTEQKQGDYKGSEVQVVGARQGGKVYGADLGRWPANFVLSHSEGCVATGEFTRAPRATNLPKDLADSLPADVQEVYRCAPGCPVAELDRQSGTSKESDRPLKRKGARQMEGWGLAAESEGVRHPGEGGASRFFYCAKPSTRERDYGCEHLPARTGGEATGRQDDSAGVRNPRAGAGRGGGRRNYHPTVKPLALMRWLCRLVTPPGGVVLDPFTGSGTTGIAALLEGYRFVGVEMTEEYLPITEARLRAALRGEKP